MKIDAFTEALKLRTPNESYRIRCKECDAVLAEYLNGVNVFKCRACKWQGVVSRTSITLVASFVTLRPGIDYRIESRNGGRGY